MQDLALNATGRADAGAWRLLTAATLAQVSTSSIAMGIPTIAPFIQADLDLTRTQVGLFAAVINIGFLCMLNVAGWAVDNIGERLVLMLGMSWVLFTTLLIATNSTYGIVITGLFMLGCGLATVTPAGSRVVMRRFPDYQRGFAMGIRQTGIPLGGAIAAGLLPAIALVAGWRSALLAAAAVCAVGALITWGLLRSAPDDGQEQAERRNQIPVRLRDLFTRDITLVCLGSLFMGPAQFVLITYLALFLFERSGLPITVGTSILLICQLGGALARIALGIVSDRWLKRRRGPVLGIAGVLAGTAAALLATLPLQAPIWIAVVLGLIFGVSSLSWHGLHITLSAELAHPQQQGRVVALNMTCLFLGIAIGTPVFGYIVDVSHSYQAAWGAIALSMWIGAGFFALVKERGSTQVAPI